MKQELIITSAIAALLATSAVSATAKNATLLSPSGNISVAVEDAPDGNLTFSISANGEKLLLPSQIAMDFEGGKKAGKIKSTSIKKDIKESFDAPFYRNPHFTTQCNELTVRLTDGNSVTFRAYDDGVAYRFSTDGKTGNVVTDEKALYNVAGNPTIYLPTPLMRRLRRLWRSRISIPSRRSVARRLCSRSSQRLSTMATG